LGVILHGKRVATVKGALSGIAFQDYAKKFGTNVTMLDRDTPAEVFAATPVMFNPTQFGFAVEKGKNRDLLLAIDQYLEKEKAYPSSTYSQSMQRWFGIKASPLIPPWLVEGLVMIAFVAIVFIVMSFFLRREVRRKTAELVRQNEELQKEIASRKQAESDLVSRNEELRAAYEQLSTTGTELKIKYLELGRSEKALMQAR
jgi:hypothetical protein